MNIYIFCFLTFDHSLFKSKRLQNTYSFEVLVEASLPLSYVTSWITLCRTAWLLYCTFITLWGFAYYNEVTSEGYKSYTWMLHLTTHTETYLHTILWRKSQEKSCWLDFPWNSFLHWHFFQVHIFASFFFFFAFFSQSLTLWVSTLPFLITLDHVCFEFIQCKS